MPKAETLHHLSLYKLYDIISGQDLKAPKPINTVPPFMKNLQIPDTQWKHIV